ncbi:Arm DNA-binding domain-containing protein [Sphingomonas sp. DG1-23]|uniref:Arm DNA-binding domain-containing protein n=1 Tax=Sphingomonas sp. DG1-23 TaxID=3068316 RepID=UPI00273F2159|nr:Arm DNA-binding domain-containing protein [Sphingomonas sp. DG1-23]MDP5281408.1 Arm DNA-binding domain-containing protein [Sphingomonas sp. DG1-23]
MLTHIKIASAKPAEKAYNLIDAQGLYLTVKPNGPKLWRMNYRFLDKQKTLHLGGWPQVGIADARTRRDDARKEIAAGIDPSLEKKRARIAAKYAAKRAEIVEQPGRDCRRVEPADCDRNSVRIG